MLSLPHNQTSNYHNISDKNTIHLINKLTYCFNKKKRPKENTIVKNLIICEYLYYYISIILYTNTNILCYVLYPIPSNFCDPLII